MSASMPGLVETSSNMAIVKAKEGQVAVHCLIRSLVDTAKEDMGTALACCFTNIEPALLFPVCIRAGNLIWILPYCR